MERLLSQISNGIKKAKLLKENINNIDISDLSVNYGYFDKVEIENEVLTCDICEKAGTFCEKDGVVCHQINDRGICDECTHHKTKHRMVNYRYEKRV